jgi:hypothetical protein
MELSFSDVRSDWYAANTLMPRLIAKAVLGIEGLRLSGFPAQWIPVCTHYGIELVAPIPPVGYLPLFSDLPLIALEELARSARAHGASRPLLEAAAALDPVLADLIYIVDHKLAAAGYKKTEGITASDSVNFLNTWHSFGRPEIIAIQERMCAHRMVGKVALLLPCSRRRPYDESRTHARVMRELSRVGHDPFKYTHIVVTALGVVPREFWRDPLVMTYNAGAVDLWRVFKLLQRFFATNYFEEIIDCLSFKPYSEMLLRLHQLGAVKRITRPVKIRWRGFNAVLP